MGRLSIYLPPFAGDYSGACSALFEFRCLIVLCDAACCTKNYIDYDEPRWSRTKTTTLCAQLRTIEAVLGDDQRILDQTVEAAAAAHPEFIALLGSPVPAVIGMDLPGMAKEVEERTGIPAFGFETTGFSSYHRGVEEAMLALFRRLGGQAESVGQNTVNLLGMTPLDLGAVGNEKLLRRALEREGYTVLCSYLMDGGLESVRQSAGASVNLVVTASGLPLAREMERVLGIPYVVGMPVGPAGVKQTVIQLKQAAEQGTRPPRKDLTAAGEDDSILIVGDQVIAHSLRLALRDLGCARPITAGSFFAMDPALMAEGDLILREERDLIQAVQSGKYTTLIGDPLLKRIPQGTGMEWIPLAHPAVSGQFGWKQVPRFSEMEMEGILGRVRLYRKEKTI